MTAPANRRKLIVPAVIAAATVAMWFAPTPEGLTPEAWRLFTIFAASIVAVVTSALPILTASVLALAISVLSGLLSPAKAYAGFSNGTILLIVVAFLVARAVVKCGLGARIGHLVVSKVGRSTMGLSYSIFVVDALLAPAFPSTTARSGVMFPLAFSLADALGAKPGPDGRLHGVGGFLMFSGIASLSLSGALWMTAMAGNPIGAEIASDFGVKISFGTWVLAACVPTLAAIFLIPQLLYRVTKPELSKTPEAPAAARRALAELGPLKPAEKIVMAVFAGMVVLWASAATLGIDSTAIAFLGLGIMLATRVLTLDDIKREGDVLATFIWFAVLFTLSGQLNELGFMGYVGEHLADAMGGFGPVAAGLTLIVAYVLAHYVFVSGTAHMLALFGVFLDVGIKLGVPATPLAFQLLFATNYFSAITPQGSAANLLFAGSGYLSQGQLYRLGALTVAASTLIYLVVGIPWLLFITR